MPRKQKRKRKRPRWERRKRIIQIRRQLAGIRTEKQDIRAEDERLARQRRSHDTRCKYLLGWAVRPRLERRLGLTEWLRRAVREVLTRVEDRQLFGLEPGTPLIPVYRSLRRSRAGASPAPSVRPDRMSPEERRQRLEALKEEERELKRELRQLQDEDRGEDEPADPSTHRYILLGVVLHTKASRRRGVTRWLRRLLDTHLKDERDRKLFRLNEPGPLFLKDESPDTAAIGQRAASNRAADGPAATHGGNTSRVAKAGERNGSEAAAGSGPRRQPTAHSPEDVSAGDAQEPISGWLPCRLPAPPSDASGRRTVTEWGARLTGVRAVAALPHELGGTKITVTDSNNRSWNTTITDVIDRNPKSITVRTSGRPSSGG